MKLEVGMYVRYEINGYTKIRKVTDFFEDSTEYDTINIFLDKDYVITEFAVIGKPSHNITDLIEKRDIIKHDILNTVEIKEIDRGKELIYFYNINFPIKFKNFNEAFDLGTLSIVTKEQFESMSYKVGE